MSLPPRPDLPPAPGAAPGRPRGAAAAVVVVAVIAAGVAAAPLLPSDDVPEASPAPVPTASPSPSVASPSFPPGCPTAAPLEPVGLPEGWVYRVDTEGDYVVAIPDAAVSERGGVTNRILVRDTAFTASVDWFDVSIAVTPHVYLKEYSDRVTASFDGLTGPIRERVVASAPMPTRAVTVSTREGAFLYRLTMAPGRVFVLAMSSSPQGFRGLDPEIRAFFRSFTPFPGCSAPSTPLP